MGIVFHRKLSVSNRGIGDLINVCEIEYKYFDVKIIKYATSQNYWFANSCVTIKNITIPNTSEL